MLDRLERRGGLALDALVEAMVLPIARRLDEPSRRDYIIILAEGSTRLGTTGLFLADQPYSDGLRRLNAHLVDTIDGPISDPPDPGWTGQPRRHRVPRRHRPPDRPRATQRPQSRRRVRGVIETVHGGLIDRRTPHVPD